MDKNFVKKEVLPLVLRLGVLAVLFTLVLINYDSLVNIETDGNRKTVPYGRIKRSEILLSE